MATMSRRRIREVIPGIRLGEYETGQLNSITDVPGVLVHTQSIKEPSTESHHAINTGVTVILPRRNYWESACHAGIFRFNGAGELTGSHWLDEAGILVSPIVVTGTFGIGAAHEGVLRHYVRETKGSNGLAEMFILPVIAETLDAYLSDVAAFPVRPEHIVQGIDEAHSGPVKEGNTGGGTGMICHHFKGGTGCSSRVVSIPNNLNGKIPKQHRFSLGVLVQANYGGMKHLRIGGVPVGIKFAEERAKADQETESVPDGSIIIVIATDAPLSPLQLQRIAKRGTVGLARVGGNGNNYSGDIFLAFSTAFDIPVERRVAGSDATAGTLRDDELDPLFEATGDAVEEAIYNALCMAETMIGPLGRRIKAIDLEKVKDLVEPRLL